ncbi:MAG TPA: PAS domain S-box protein [Bryobacteraceae bacterium]|nr:PAS domain S-box protein [Bryobacteraceae bacterium]
MSTAAAGHGDAQAALSERSEPLQEIFSHAAVGIAQIGLDGEWLLVNRRYCEMLGYPEAELRQKKITDITHPDDWEQDRAVQRRLLSGEASSDTIERRYIRKDGSIYWGRLHRSLVRDRENRPKYFIAIVEDITKQKEAEEAVRHSELVNRQVLDIIPDCVFVLDVTPDRRFKFVWLNPAEEKSVGLTNDQVLGKFVEDVTSEEVANKVTARYRRCLDEGMNISYDEELDLPIGRRYFHTRLIPVFNSAGRIHRIVGCCIDFTEANRMQAEALARQKWESMGVLAGGIAHDFNNLLGGILASVEVALAEGPVGKPLTEQLQRIRTAAIHGAEIVRQLMIYGGKDRPHRETLDLSVLIEEMLQLLKVSIAKHPVLKLDLGANLPPLRANPAQLRQVVMNLVTNASEAIGNREGTIRVATSWVKVGKKPADAALKGLSKGDFVKLEVSDTGAGMTPEVQSRLFDPFFSTKFAGRGLGLAVVQRIVQDHQGAISVSSAPGRGATFQIWLPCVADQAAPAQDGAREPEARPSSTGAILLVEDEDLLRLAVAKALRKAGFTVLEARDGSAAIELIRTAAEIQLVLLDATLPGASSRDVFESARNKRPGLKILLTSAYREETVYASLRGLRADRFIRKPFHLADLIQAVGTILQ